MTVHSNTSPSQRIARATGLAYLGIVFFGIFAEFFVRMSLVDPTDAAATASNIAGSAGLFRAGLAADVLMIALDVCVAVGFYALLSRVNRPLALLAAAMRLVQASILGANLMNMASAVEGAATGAPGELVLSSMQLHRMVYDLGLIFFGFSCLILGRLIWTSRLLPRALGAGLLISGLIYLLGSFSLILNPALAAALDPMYGFTVLAELGVAGWLTIKGVRTESTSQTARKASPILAATALALASTACGFPDKEAEEKHSDMQESAGEVKEEIVSWPGLGERGQYAVGHRVFESTNPDLSVKAWYPTEAEEADIEYEVVFQADYYGAPTGTIVGRATRDANLAESGAAFPIVVFSHGFSLNPAWYSALTEHMASHGFVVLAPEHPEGDWDATVVDASFDRPLKVSQTIDLAERLANQGEWEGGIDITRIAVVGHSYGGYTALAVGGAEFDAPSLATECVALDPMDPKAFLCAPFSSDEAVVGRFAEMQDESSVMRDERVTAVVSIAGDAYLFGAAGLSQLTIPVLAIGGTGDNYSPWDWGSELTFESVSSEHAALVGLEGADHMIAVNPCDQMPWTASLPDEFTAILCSDPVWDRGDALTTVQQFTTAFLFDTLKNNTSARTALAESDMDEDGVLYRATW